MLMEDIVGGFSRNWTGSRVLEKMQKEYLVKNLHRKSRRVFDQLTESSRARAKGNKAGGVKEGV